MRSAHTPKQRKKKQFEQNREGKEEMRDNFTKEDASTFTRTLLWSQKDGFASCSKVYSNGLDAKSQAEKLCTVQVF